MKNTYISLRTVILALLLGLSYQSYAQSTTINTTVGSTGYDGGNNAGANGWITFAVHNGSGGDLKITEVATWSQTLHNNTVSTLWYSSTSLGGAATPLATPVWNVAASATVTGITTAGIYPVLRNINFVVPDGVTYRFALETTATQVNYSLSSTCTPNNFTAGGMTLYTGNHQIGGNVGYAYPNGNNPRFFTGYITFEPAAVPCDDTLTSAVVVGPDITCPLKPFSLAVGLQSGLLISGLTYQWQYSNNGSSWANFTGVPNVSKGGEITDAITAEKWYRCRVTCTATGDTYVTPVHKVSIAPFYYCYCDNTVTLDDDADVGKVLVIDTKNDDTVFNKSLLATGTGVPVYNNGDARRTYTAYHDSLAWPCLYMDTTYNFVVTQIHPGGSLQPSVVQVYVDYNRDGLYDPNTERVLIQAINGAGSTPEEVRMTGTVPSFAGVGPTGMRVIISEDTVNGAPCGILPGYGEVEDFIVEICHRRCDGPVSAGIVVATDTSMCTGYEYTLTDTTYSKTVSGYNRSWQVSGDDQTWFNINNSTGKDTLERSFTGQPLYYRYRTICPGTNDTAYSPATFINTKPGYKCYCYSKADGGLLFDTSDIGGVTIAGYSSNTGGPHLLNPGAHYPRTDYTDISPIELFTDSSYRFTVYHTMPVAEHGDAKITIFMDFDNDHEYDIPDERIYTGFTAIGTHTLVDNVVVPLNAILDAPTGMRVILNNNVGPNDPSDMACGPYTSGETEDYIVIFRKKVPDGVNELSKLNGFSIHPNPTDGKFHIRFSTHTEISEVAVRITNITGQVVQSETYSHDGGVFSKEIDLGMQVPGVYFIELQADGQRLIRKLVVQ